MPSGALWTFAEEQAFVQFLLDHKSEGGDGATFKGPTYQKALAHIAPLRERGAVKNIKSLQNKWTAFKKIYCVILAIQSVSGWSWDDEKGANINVHSASSWDDYVKKHPSAKPFRNKGWPHLLKVTLIMPTTASGANVFVPTQDGSIEAEDNEDSDQSTPGPCSESPARESLDLGHDRTPPPPPDPITRKRAHEPATPTQPISKRIRASKNTMALESMSTSLSVFGTTIVNALNGPPSAHIDPTPVRRTTAIKSLIDLEKEWLSEDELVVLIDFLRTDLTAADTYTTLTKSNVRQSWVCAQLRKFNFEL